MEPNGIDQEGRVAKPTSKKVVKNCVKSKQARKKTVNAPQHSTDNSGVFGNIDLKIKAFQDELLKLDQQAQAAELLEAEWYRRMAVQTQLRLWMIRKEWYWKQMSRCRILKEGDKNTQYFHITASIRRRKKPLEKVVTQGNVITELSFIKKAIVDHFRELYTKQPVALFDITNLSL